MPRSWQGRWKGGRYYLDARNRPVYVIERRVAGRTRALTLETHDEDFAVGELARFEADPERYTLQHLTRLMGDRAEVEGRTLWAVWCEAAWLYLREPVTERRR